VRDAVEFALPSGRHVVATELTVAEMLIAKRAAGNGVGLAASSAVSIAGLQMAIREIDGVKVSFDQLGGIEGRFRVRDLTALVSAFASLHAAPKLAYTVIPGERTDVYTVTLLDGSTVTLRELAHPAFSRCMAAGDAERGCPSSMEFAVGLAGLRASIAGIPSDNVLWPYSARDTTGLMALWGEIHGGDFTVVPSAA